MWIRLLACAAVASSMHAGALQLTVSNYADVPTPVLSTATREAARVLSAASIVTRWRTPSGKGIPPGGIHVNLITDDMAVRLSISDKSCGSALPKGSVVWVRYACATTLAQAPHAQQIGRVLGCLIAHEIGHILLVEHRHDDSGLLRAEWGRNELAAIARGVLTFQSPDQIGRDAQPWIEKRGESGR